MEILIQYDTKERIYFNSQLYHHAYKKVYLEPVRIFRTPCGRTGAALKRYFYHGEFVAPIDAEHSYNGHIKAHINRKTNKIFCPKKLTFTDDIWSKS